MNNQLTLNAKHPAFIEWVHDVVSSGHHEPYDLIGLNLLIFETLEQYGAEPSRRVNAVNDLYAIELKFSTPAHRTLFLLNYSNSRSRLDK